MQIEPIAHIESPYPTKFGVPRQPGLVRELVSWLVFDGGRAADGRADLPAPGSRVWVIWGFSENERPGSGWSPTIRPPRLGGNRRVGVFASRSSFRPNGLAISCVEVAGVDSGERSGGRVGRVPFTGGDMVDGTPVYALRPYDPARDFAPDASSGWLTGRGWPALDGVQIPADLEARIPPELSCGVREVILQDPRPAYTRATQPGREFWVPIGRIVVWFTVDDARAVARVTRVRALDDAAYARLKEEGSIS